MATILHLHLHNAADLGELRALTAVAAALSQRQKAKDKNSLREALGWGFSLAALGAAVGFLSTTPLLLPAVASFGLVLLIGVACESLSN
ncbi:hypothetical protein [Fischerella sp. PCC 9605]|uniref:hypothetical protein n=1 Tax=Fischerella sp. PCC 9605 TaxID=1173024 RepID=UPI00047ABBA5|nr:hypothetical protein [Fischerella sp. PCC 9605]